MNEVQWAKTVQGLVRQFLAEKHPNLDILQGANLPYANEVLEYQGDQAKEIRSSAYETDLLVVEKFTSGNWKPRVVIECKIDSVTTHDAITYSEKSFAHKKVHPYIRYGILLGNRKHYPLPGHNLQKTIRFSVALA